MSNNPSMFGYQFQADTAVYLFIKNILSCDNIKVEGKFEDIELLLSSGDVLYCQAKASYYPKKIADTAKLAKAIKTLSTIYNNKDYFIYATNQLTPIDTLKNSFDDEAIVTKRFDELNELEQQKIKNYYNKKNINVGSNFIVLRIPYESNVPTNDSRRFMIERMVSLLKSLKEPLRNASVIYELWSSYLNHNSSRDKTLTVSFREMIMLYHGYFILQKSTTSPEADLIDDYFYDIVQTKVNRYDIINKIVQTYSKSSITDYVNNNLEMLNELVFSKCEEPTQNEKIAIRLIVQSVIEYSDRFIKFKEIFDK